MLHFHSRTIRDSLLKYGYEIDLVEAAFHDSVRKDIFAAENLSSRINSSAVLVLQTADTNMTIIDLEFIRADVEKALGTICQDIQ